MNQCCMVECESSDGSDGDYNVGASSSFQSESNPDPARHPRWIIPEEDEGLELHEMDQFGTDGDSDDDDDDDGNSTELHRVSSIL